MRQVFSTPRLAEFASMQGLTSRVGLRPDWWAWAVVKELLDNVLDAAETAGLAPVARVTIAEDSITVEDEGPGIDPDIVGCIFDYDRQTSSREAYVEPTRGAQGNALQTILAMPFVLSEGERGELVIESRNVRHDLVFTSDPITGLPAIEHSRAPSEVSLGTRVSVKWPHAFGANPKMIAERFTAFNPHLTITVNGRMFVASDATWERWTPNRPPVAHWYNPTTFKRLVQAYAGSGEPMTVGAFVREFAGLTGTQKAAGIVTPLGLPRMNLIDLLRAPGKLAPLLDTMQAATKPVKANELGVLGRDHIENEADCYGVERIEYLKQTFETDGLPYIAEVAFGESSDEKNARVLLTGLNFSLIFTEPFRGFNALLAERHVEPPDPVFVFVHLACPRFAFVDKGKTSIDLPAVVDDGVVEMITKVTARWSRKKVAALRGRPIKRDPSEKKMSVKDAAYEVMPEAYAHAAGDIGLANARQVMYAARPQILALTGLTGFGDNYFTQILLPDYQREFPRVTEDWDVVYDDRGHFIEPHTGRMIGLGTLAVRNYFAKVEAPSVRAAEVISSIISTFGPQGRFSSALFIEKEGFLAILERARIAERYDVALMSTKGMSVVASRALIDGLAALGVRVFVLHDFDVSGFSIRKTFTESGRRYEFQNELDYVDIGLRLEDVRALDLPSEPVNLFPRESKKSIEERMATLIERLKTNGATDEEIEFLIQGQRVELNAMTSDEFVAFVERKLEENGVAKVIPNGGIIQDAYAAYVRGEKAKARFAEEMERAAGEPADIPADIEERVRGWIQENPEAPWTNAIAAIVEEDDDAAE